MKKNNDKPKLRFPGFNDPWEQRKLGEISDKVTEKNTENFYDETLTNSAEFGIVTQRDFFDKNISNAKNLNGYYVVQNDDFVYNPRISNFAPVGPIKRNKLARTGVMSPLYYVFRTHDIDKTYLEHYFDTTCWHSFMKLNGDSGARSDRFAIKDSVFIEMPIPFPNLEEQKKIGKFFDTITNLVTLHQRKLNHLQDKKKSLLQKMFPKNGEDFPELRFPGFTDPWEQRKLGELVEQVIREVSKPTTPYDRVSVRSHAKGTFHQHVDDPSKVAMEKLFVVRNKDLIVSITFAWEHAIAVANETDDGLLVSHRFPTYRADGKSDIEFLHYLVSQEKFRQKLELISPGGAGRNRVLNKNDFIKIEVIVPDDIEEQKKIGFFFKQLDALITLNQRKLNHLQEQKKALLQQMFI